MQAFRARHDASYARYERISAEGNPGHWRVLLPSGLTLYFGENPTARDQREPLSPVDMYADEGRWFLTRTVDQFGNQVRYAYEKVRGNAANGLVTNAPVDIALASIEYTANPAQGLEPHARILFEYAPGFDLCTGSNVPIGAQFTYRTGIRTYKGAKRLNVIRVQVKKVEGLSQPELQDPVGGGVIFFSPPELQDPAGGAAPPPVPTQWHTRREIHLGYEDEHELQCKVERAPLRLLTSIRERVFSHEDAFLDLPAVTFDYGIPERTFGREIDLPLKGDGGTAITKGHRRLSTEKAGGWPTTDQMFIDLNGDGRPDLLESPSVMTCDIEARMSAAPGGFAPPRAAMWPSLPWALAHANDDENLEENCNLGYQLSRRSNRTDCAGLPANYTSFRLIDLDGDGTPELVTALDMKVGRFAPTPSDVLYQGNTYGGMPECGGGALPCRNSEGKAQMCAFDDLYAKLAAPQFAQNNDSQGGEQPLPEPKETEPVVCFGNECKSCAVDYETPLSGQWKCECSVDACLGGGSKDPPTGVGSIQEPPDPGSGWLGMKWASGDIGQEGKKTGQLNPQCNFVSESSCGRYVWRVYRWDADQGTFANPRVVLSPIPLESNRAVAPRSSVLQASASSWHALIDIDGDSCVDLVWQQSQHRDPEWGGDFQVFRGDCAGGFQGDPAKGGQEPYYWRTPDLGQRPVVSLSRTGYTARRTNKDFHRFTEATVALEDINGDGLPDYVIAMPLEGDPPPPAGPREAGNHMPLRVYYNTGNGFEDVHATVLSNYLTTTSRNEQVLLEAHDVTNDLDVGYSLELIQSLDYDLDGLSDFVQLLPPKELPLGTEVYDPWKAREPLVIPHVAVGDWFFPVVASSDPDLAVSLGRITVSTNQRWAVKTDVSDFDGDGIWDLFPNRGRTDGCGHTWGGAYASNMWSGCGTSTAAISGKDDAAGLPKRFLRKIENGRGAKVLFEYRSGNDPKVVESNLTEGDRLPQPIWVVKSMKVSVPQGGQDLVTSTEMRYLRPVFNADEDGKFGFRGFRAVLTTTGADGAGERARSVARFDYDLDYSGRQVEELAFDGRGGIESISTTAWTRHELFGGVVSTYHVAESASRVCDKPTPINLPKDIPYESQTQREQEAACRSSGALSRTVNTWSPLGPPPDTAAPQFLAAPAPGAGIPAPPVGVVGTPVFYVNTSQRLTTTEGAVAEGDRGTTTTYGLVYEAGRYNLLATESRRFEATGPGTATAWGPTRLLGRTWTKYDDDHKGLPLETHVWMDETTVAITTRTFDAVGNAVTVQKPEQRGTSIVTKLQYDAFRLYPTRTTHTRAGGAPSHVVMTVLDLATGKPLIQAGPFQPSHGWPGEITRYDGLGRPLETRRTRDNGTGGYEYVSVFKAQYFDKEIPARVRTQSRIDYDQDTWGVSEATYDSLGRPVRQSVQSAQGWVHTTNTYDARGHVVRVESPNPAGPGTVSYHYEYDALGRVTRFQAPLGAPVSFVYSGLTTEQLQSTSDESEGFHKVLVNDVFGRLVTVVEHGSGGMEAVTRYAYDGNDNMTHIVDADGIETRMLHDWTGNRTEIERAGRTWRYSYDRNGNMTGETLPNDASVYSQGLYTTTIDYDELDRPTSRRTLTLGLDAAKYELDEVIYEYDDLEHANGLGRLTAVTWWDGAGASYEYTAEGLVTEERRWFETAPFGQTIKDERTIKRTYNAMGLPVRTVHADDFDAPSVTVAEYDERGLPRALRLEPLPTTEPPKDVIVKPTLPPIGGIIATKAAVTSFAAPTSPRPTVSVAGFIKDPVVVAAPAPEPQSILLARIDRNLAGLATRRVSDYAQAQTWTYDAAGRVTANVIRRCEGKTGLSASVTCATSGTNAGGEQLTFWDSGNVKSVTEPHTARALSFTYDKQQQLATARSFPLTTDYAANFTYTPGGRVDSVYIGSSAAEVTSRNVSYLYPDGGGTAGADPAAVSALEDLDNPGSDRGAFEYDARGNLTRRVVDGVATVFVYDGDDRLREAIVNGTEREVYYYDHGGQRFLTVRDSGTATFWFGETEIAYDTTSGKPSERQVYAGLGDMPIARITRGSSTTPKIHLTYNGVLGHLLTVLGTDNKVVASYRYSPYGEILSTTGSLAETFQRLFNGKELDRATGLAYYGFRYYDRLTLTWTQADPLYRYAPDLGYEEPRRIALYTFVLSSPLSFSDPNGLWPEFVHSAADWASRATRAAGRQVADTAKGVGKQALDNLKRVKENPLILTRPEKLAFDTLFEAALELPEQAKDLKDLAGQMMDGDAEAWGKGMVVVGGFILSKRFGGGRGRGRYEPPSVQTQQIRIGLTKNGDIRVEILDATGNVVKDITNLRVKEWELNPKNPTGRPQLKKQPRDQKAKKYPGNKHKREPNKQERAILEAAEEASQKTR